MTLAEHERYIDAMSDALGEQYRRHEERWQAHIREHRPDLVGCPDPLGDKISELKAEINELRRERDALEDEP